MNGEVQLGGHVDDEPDEGPPPTATPPRGRSGRRKSNRLRRILTITGAVLTTLIVCSGLALAVVVHHVLEGYRQNLSSIGNPFPTNGRPEPSTKASAATNLLVICLDRPPSSEVRWRQISTARARFVLLVHIAGDRKTIDAVSIPLDSTADLPTNPHGPAPNDTTPTGRARTIGAAFESGGFMLPVREVENLTRVRLDHVLVMDFDGFKAIIDALGGVRVTVTGTTDNDPSSTIQAGPQVIDGTQARQYLEGTASSRQTATRARDLIHAIHAKLVSSSRLTSPMEQVDFGDILTRNLAVDDALRSDPYGLAWSLRRVGLGGLRFITPPQADLGSASRDGHRTTESAAADTGSLWTAVKTDTVNNWIAGNGPQIN